MKLLKDATGKTSSKRIMGICLIGVGMIGAGILFKYSLTTGAKDPITASNLINMFLITGSALLGFGVFEGFKLRNSKPTDGE